MQLDGRHVRLVGFRALYGQLWQRLLARLAGAYELPIGSVGLSHGLVAVRGHDNRSRVYGAWRLTGIVFLHGVGPHELLLEDGILGHVVPHTLLFVEHTSTCA